MRRTWALLVFLVAPFSGCLEGSTVELLEVPTEAAAPVRLLCEQTQSYGFLVDDVYDWMRLDVDVRTATDVAYVFERRGSGEQRSSGPATDPDLFQDDPEQGQWTLRVEGGPCPAGSAQSVVLDGGHFVVRAKVK
ncbi:MAG: hypothetical protein ACT4PT_09330 [Methanobacteriota archaeon]